MRAVVVPDVLTAPEAAAMEAAVPFGPRVKADLAMGGWAKPIEAAIRRHYDDLAAPFPVARRSIGRSLVVAGRGAVWAAGAARGEPEGWRRSNTPRPEFCVIRYGGDFEGGALEVEGGDRYAVSRNSLLAYWPGDRHRVLPTTGARLSVRFGLRRWRFPRPAAEPSPGGVPAQALPPRPAAAAPPYPGSLLWGVRPADLVQGWKEALIAPLPRPRNDTGGARQRRPALFPCGRVHGWSGGSPRQRHGVEPPPLLRGSDNEAGPARGRRPCAARARGRATVHPPSGSPVAWRLACSSAMRGA